ncbi:uncharacterized protein LOC132720959 isoform X2 [Ruditapes philippinarum]|uniref:uncharacterized protein LOC132720959 isoform X2 n=1 Tax=Ruditapes philippinarum TaxID=129788 RepID=UPI00295BF189|nr:uncharacterized protein LOC132720959 isoform X2 [Ruditapes philippinarum]
MIHLYYRDISSSEAHCGCLWQTYIQTIEPAAQVIFTNKGKHCYLWAAKLCSILENNERIVLNRRNSPKRPKTTVFRNSHELEHFLTQIQKIESIQENGRKVKEIAKKRRRNGVGTLTKELENLLNKEKEAIRKSQAASLKQAIITGTLSKKSKRHAYGDFIGGTVSWVEVVPEIQTVKQTVNYPPISLSKVNGVENVKDIYTVRQHWIDLDMPVDQFKLGVFMIILLLNILVVVVLIFCRGSDRAKKQFETKRPPGDLNLDDRSEQGRKKKPMSSPFSAFLKSCSKKINQRKKKENASTKYLEQMIEVNPDVYTTNRNAHSKVRENSPYINIEMSPKKISRGLYEGIDEESEGLLDNTYEEPVSVRSNDTENPREFQKRNYSRRLDSVSEDESLPPSKYFTRESDASNKSVSFSLSPNTYLTLQDRMLVHPSSRRKRLRRKGITMPFKMTK